LGDASKVVSSSLTDPNRSSSESTNDGVFGVFFVRRVEVTRVLTLTAYLNGLFWLWLFFNFDFFRSREL
jgi:hypothetical protein